MRKIAYGLLAALLIAGAGWIFFFFGGAANFCAHYSRKPPVVSKIPHGGGGMVKKFPLPEPSIPSGQCPLPPGNALPAATPAGPGKPAEIKKAAPAKAPPKFNENYDKLIERLLRKKSTSPGAIPGNLLEIPLPDSGGAHK